MRGEVHGLVKDAGVEVYGVDSSSAYEELFD